MTFYVLNNKVLAMMDSLILNNQSDSAAALSHLLSEMKAQTLAHPLSLDQRAALLRAAIALLTDNQDSLCEAYSRDFGHRAARTTLLSDILGSVEALRDALTHLPEWAADEARSTPFAGSRASVIRQPLGVVGIMSPWNFPLVLTFGPMAGALAAGNRILIKPSEYTPAGSALLCRLISDYFDPRLVSSVQGGLEAAQAFSSLPLDHLIFTGSTATGKAIMRAAAENLTPVTLELGGKSPTLVSTSADIAQAAARILTVKTFNAGQICISPDYVLIHENSLEAFIQAAREFCQAQFGGFINNPDYTSIINSQQVQRLQSHLTDARARGCRVIPLSDEEHDFARRRIVPSLIIDPDSEALCMQEEIFGPLLPVITWRTFDRAVEAINARPHPLALYYFGADPHEIATLKQHTRSGALVINDVMSHVVVHDLPFGGVGHSGTGAYHGKEGYLRFSNSRALFEQSEGGESNLLMRAPYGPESDEIIKNMLKS